MLAEMKSDQVIVGWRWWVCFWLRYNGEARLVSPLRSNSSEWQPRRMPPPAMHHGTMLSWCNLCRIDVRDNPGRCPGDLEHGIAAQATWLEDALELDDAHRVGRAVGCLLCERDMVGYYAYRSPRKLQNNMSYAPEIVVGTVSLWGTVRVYKEGYRAQYAYPRTLYVADEFPEMRRALAQGYGVEAYPRSALPFGLLSPKDAWLADRLNQPPS